MTKRLVCWRQDDKEDGGITMVLLIKVQGLWWSLVSDYKEAWDWYNTWPLLLRNLVGLWHLLHEGDNHNYDQHMTNYYLHTRQSRCLGIGRARGLKETAHLRKYAFLIGFE